ncbi:MAG: hypothetical protein NTX75_14025 [Proteobacteria bacterium]|nr:hypothetical protein [Pseudomonadota bacterium]
MKTLIIILLLFAMGIFMYACSTACVVVPREGGKEPVTIQYPK